MRRTTLGVIAVLIAACGSAGGTVEQREPTARSATPRPVELDGSRETSRQAALGVRADGCGPRVGIGSASLIDDGVAITAAHVVAGADRVTVIDLDFAEHEASVVAIDPDLDVALLRVPVGIGRPLDIGDRRVRADDVGAVTAVRATSATGGAVTLDVRVLRRANVATTDVYLDGEVVRPGFEIAAAIERGDSGAVVVVAGQATGVVWSRSVERDGRAWVVDIPDGYRDPAVRRTLVDAVDTGDCP